MIHYLLVYIGIEDILITVAGVIMIMWIPNGFKTFVSSMLHSLSSNFIHLLQGISEVRAFIKSLKIGILCNPQCG